MKRSNDERNRDDNGSELEKNGRIERMSEKRFPKRTVGLKITRARKQRKTSKSSKVMWKRKVTCENNLTDYRCQNKEAQRKSMEIRHRRQMR